MTHNWIEDQGDNRFVNVVYTYSSRGKQRILWKNILSFSSSSQREKQKDFFFWNLLTIINERNLNQSEIEPIVGQQKNVIIIELGLNPQQFIRENVYADRSSKFFPQFKSYPQSQSYPQSKSFSIYCKKFNKFQTRVSHGTLTWTQRWL